MTTLKSEEESMACLRKVLPNQVCVVINYVSLVLIKQPINLTIEIVESAKMFTFA